MSVISSTGSKHKWVTSLFHYGGYCAFWANKNKVFFFARIFDITLHVIISGIGMREKRGIQRHRGERGGGREEARDTERIRPIKGWPPLLILMYLRNILIKLYGVVEWLCRNWFHRSRECGKSLSIHRLLTHDHSWKRERERQKEWVCMQRSSWFIDFWRTIITGNRKKEIQEFICTHELAIHRRLEHNHSWKWKER